MTESRAYLMMDQNQQIISRDSIERRHDAGDTAKIASLVESIRAQGWMGAPIVVYDSGVWIAVTGMHRLAACDQIDYQPPFCDLRDLFAAAGLDLDHIAEDEGYDLSRILPYLPAKIREQYGIET